jgi:hypothetical protein
MAIFKKDKKEQVANQPQVMQVNLVDVVKQANVQMKYEEIGSWLMMHKTPLFFCHDKGLSIVDKNFIDDRPWLKKALTKLVNEIDEHRKKAQQPAQPHENPISEPKVEKEEKTGYFG